MLFDFLGMTDNYEDRKVDRFEQGDLMVSTVEVNDGQQLFETAVLHPQYRDGEHVIVEAYDTKEEAQEGHNRWVAVMTADELPEQLTDCANSEVQQMTGVEVFARQG